MSGIKETRITMTRTERDRLVNNARTAAESQQQAERRAQAAQAAQREAQTRVNALSNTLNSEIAGLHSDITRLTRQQDRKLAQQALNFDGKLDNLRTELQAQMEHNKRELNTAINSIQSQMDSEKRENKAVAEYWVNQCRAVFSKIGQYRHDMFAPGKLQSLMDELSQTDSDMRTGRRFEATIANARERFNRAIALRSEIIVAEEEWKRQYVIFTQALADTKSNLVFREEMKFEIETSEGKEIVPADINYWSDGMLNNVRDTITEIEAGVKTPENIPVKDLKELSNELERSNEIMQQAEEIARMRLTASQKRADLAQDIVDAFSGTEWRYADSTYEGEESTEAVHIKLTDGAENSIVVIIEPAEGMDNNLQIHGFFTDNTDSLREEWLRSIRNHLSDSGINTDEFVCREGYERVSSDNNNLLNLQNTAQKPVHRQTTLKG
ncbi:MAG: hypothetical protein FWG90_00055 [Oscillospiraceae bacterium]|nr:hypothetical protein [Oscillospiraceae bacterium]